SAEDTPTEILNEMPDIDNPTKSGSGPEIILQKGTDAGHIFDSPGEMEAGNGQRSKLSPFMNFVKKTVRENERSVKEALGRKIHYNLPALTLLNTPITEESKLDRDELLRNSKMLEEKLADFNVKGQVMAVKPGPVVTMYEFKP